MVNQKNIPRMPVTRSGKIMSHKRLLLVAILALLLAGYLAYSKARGSSAQTQYVTVAVQKGMITSSVSSSGNLTVGESVNVTPSVSGTVTGLAVKLGDNVTKGQVLFSLINDSTDVTVAKSYAGVLSAQQQVDSAEAQLTQTQVDYDNAAGQAGSPASANMEALEAKQNAARQSLSSAETSLNSAETSLSVARDNYNNAQSSYQITPSTQTYKDLNTAKTQLASAQSQVASAQSQVASAQANVTQASSDIVKAQQQSQAGAEGLSAYQAKIDSASSSVAAAQQSLAATQADYDNQVKLAGGRTVTAPMDGTITSVNVKDGDMISSSGTVTSGSSGSSAGSGSSGASSSGSEGGSADSAGSSSSSSSTGSSSSDSSSAGTSSSSSVPVVIENMGSLAATVQATEIDATKIALGQKATLTFDAIDSLTLTGKVIKIDSAGTASQGVVTFNVTIGLDSAEPRLKPGMNVTAAITTAVNQDVLTVPSSAVKTQTGGGSYVLVLQNGVTSQQTVTVGLTSDTESEVSGLSEGDEVVTQTIDPSAASTPAGSSSGGFNLGGGQPTGGGGPPPGGGSFGAGGPGG
jgi:multidrug efflux pump subunit AcrA (membrane-fusion protein)